MKDFLLFRKMMTPALIQLFFWLAVAASIATGVYVLMKFKDYVTAIELFVLGPIAARIICETLIVFFRINASLGDMKKHFDGPSTIL